MSDSPRRGARSSVVDLFSRKSREEAELGLFGSSILALWSWGWVGVGRQAGRGRATAGEGDCVVAGGGNWVRLVRRFGEFG